EYSEANCSESRLDSLKADIKFQLPPLKIKPGEEYLITIYRRILDSDTVKLWNYKLNGPSRGSWDVSYGLAFGINTFNKEGSYHLSGVDSTYTITESGNTDLMNLIPSVFFTWKLNPNNPISFGLSGG